MWVETPSNPLLRIVDIRKLADKAHAIGAWLLVDNTFLSPVWQQAAVAGRGFRAAFDDQISERPQRRGRRRRSFPSTPELHERMVWWANCIGVTGAPFDSFMTLRGIRTLHARLKVHGDNALKIATCLERSPGGEEGALPGLPSHPQHELAKRQQAGFGAMVSFELRGGIPECVCLPRRAADVLAGGIAGRRGEPRRASVRQ